ncbi:exodeoxyribonuclease VII large subunit [Rhodovastum atsumiense]|uniref:Exodeoxyribonuclease 7 large subunit n=1 Tax=Rhodovastum atsumiense TaxID=504468 RepID=A0A5M6IUE3_9PROT|nr:exodeoxyribonuclease VII large subunit [Rhodovastum atsumiense]KAA5611487.1 exodeoxyribonuclease VII large subunit [Rhodovastum atsumiense]
MGETRLLPAGNIPEYSVSEISGAVKRTLEGAFGRVRVRGEITELKRYPSGHIYLSLKDEGGKIAAVVWKSSVPRLGLDPENGVEVIAQGRITAYGERSTYQLIIERMEYAGAGALLARIEMLRQRLAEEGLFAPERKQPIPLLPRVVGVVTSERGAVIQDIRTTILRRFPRPILLWPVPVLGEGAAAQIAAAIRGFDALPEGGTVPRPDVLIVARGGGSLEDLMAFNEEVVVRAAAECRIPLISAVGHETDTTLIDFASDRRAPTPTAAAELAVPSRTELAADLAQKAARLTGALNRLAQERRLRLQRAERGLPDLPSLVGVARQRLDDRAVRLGLALPNFLAARRAGLDRSAARLPDLAAMLRERRAALEERGRRLLVALPALVAGRRAALVDVERHLPPPKQITEARQGAVALLGQRLRAGLQHSTAQRQQAGARVMPRLSVASIRASLREMRSRLDGVAGRLEAVSPEAVLARGYALVFDRKGTPVTSAVTVKPGTELRLHFADGDAKVTAEGGRKTRQGSLPL